MAFLFLPAVHNSLFNQSKDAVAVANSIQRSGNNPSSTHKASPVLDALCNSIAKFVILFQINRYFFYIACAVYWGIDVNFGQHMVCSWAFGVFVSHYMKDLLMIPRLSKHKLSQEYCKRMWKKYNVNFDSCWDIPYEPIVSFTSAIASIGTICIFISPENTAWLICSMFLLIGVPAYSFFRLNITSITSIVSSLLVGITVPILWIYCIIGKQFNSDYNLSKKAGTAFLIVSNNGAVYNLSCVFLVAVVLLLAYPIPFKYNFSFPYVSKSIFTASGFIAGMLIREYFIDIRGGNNVNSSVDDCDPSYSMLYQTTFETIFFSGSKNNRENAVYDRLNSFEEEHSTQQTPSDCVYSGSLNALFAFFILSVMQFFCRYIFLQKFKYAQICFPCFRPRLSTNATSILENSVHKINPSVERAREQLYECKRLRRQFEEACRAMEKKQRLMSGNNNKVYNKSKGKTLENKSLSPYEHIIYEYAIPTNICYGFFDGFIASFLAPYFLSIMK